MVKVVKVGGNKDFYFMPEAWAFALFMTGKLGFDTSANAYAQVQR